MARWAYGRREKRRSGARWQAERAIWIYRRGTVSDVAPAVASQSNSCEMSRHGTCASKIRGCTPSWICVLFGSTSGVGERAAPDGRLVGWVESRRRVGGPAGMSSSKRDLHRFEWSVYGGYGDGNMSESIKGISNFNLWNEVSMVVSVVAKIRMEWFRVITWFEVKVMYINY